MRRAFAVLVLAVPAALLAAPVAGAGGGRPAGPPPPGAPAAGPVAVQTGDTTKQHLAVATQSRRGKRLQANDAATPPSPETAPAMSVSSPLAAACDDAPSVTPLVPGARAPPAGGAAAPSA